MGLDWFSVPMKVSGGRTPDLDFFLEVWGYIRGVGVGNRSGGGPRGSHEVGGAPSTLVVAAGMMKMATGDDSPLR